MNNEKLESGYNLFFKCKSRSFLDFTEDITQFTTNYLDYIQKHKIFELNVRCQ